MASQFDSARRPQLQRRQGPVQDRVVDTRTRSLPQPDGGMSGEARGLLEGLAVFNGALTRHLVQQDQQEIARVSKMGALAGAEMRLEDANDQSLDTSPADVPPAYSDHYLKALRQTVGERIGIKAKQDLLSEYQAKAGEEGFDPDSFLTDWETYQFAGFRDPDVRLALAKHHNEGAALIRQDQNKRRQERLDETATSAVSQQLQNDLPGHFTAQELFDSYQTKTLPQARVLGRHTPKEMAQMFLGHLTALSNERGGAPELFEAFTDHQDAEGFTLTGRNPELVSAVQNAKFTALRMREDRMVKSTEDDRAKGLMALEDKLRANPASVTDEFLLESMQGWGPIRTVEQLMHYRRQRDELMAKGAGLSAAVDAARAGQAWALSPEDQGKVMEAIAAPALSSFRTMLTAATQAQTAEDRTAALSMASQVGVAIQAAHVEARTSVPAAPVKRFFTAIAQNVPAKDGEPDAQFETAVAMYRALPENLRAIYTDDDTKQLLETYQAQVDNGAAPAAAYQTAYRAISPEAKKAAAEFVKTPEFAARVAEVTRKYVSGTVPFVPSFVAKRFGWEPTNQHALNVELKSETERYMRVNPNALETDIEAHTERWMADNYVLDRGTGTAIRVPPGMANDGTRLAVQSFTDGLRTEHRLSDRRDGAWSVILQASNLQQGTYVPMLARDGVPVEPLRGKPVVNIQEILQNYKEKTTFTPDEGKLLVGLRDKLRAGTITPEEQDANAKLIQKAKTLGFFGTPETARAEQLRDQVMRQRLSTIPKMEFGAPSADNIVNTANTRVNHKLTASTATRFFGAGGDVGLAAALVTVGEGVVLQAYPDPNSDAGQNIGTGYNLKANARHVHQDLKRAGVPAERIEDVINGRAALTPDQSSRLTTVALGRYEKLASSAAEKADPGLWRRMTPAQRAVMIDIAWQTGNPEQFQKAFDALARGDSAAFAQSVKVHYRKKAGGALIEDKRRNNLRAHMLSGSFGAVIGETGRVPSSRLDQVALD